MELLRNKMVGVVPRLRENRRELKSAEPQAKLVALGVVKVVADDVLGVLEKPSYEVDKDRKRRSRKNKYDEEDLREQFTKAFEGADYPIEKRRELYPALPDGVNTTFESNGNSFGVLKLYQRTGGRGDYPYHDVETLTDDLIEGMKEEGYVG